MIKDILVMVKARCGAYFCAKVYPITVTKTPVYPLNDRLSPGGRILHPFRGQPRRKTATLSA